MIAHRRYVTIEDPRRVVLSNLPFRTGERVEVVLIADDEREARVRELQALLKATQALPQASIITEDEIAAEIALYHSGR